MSTQNGKLVTCDRCGFSIFLKHTGTGDADGGYTKWDKFEPLPDTWLYQSQTGYLCDVCAKAFREWVTNFMDGRVAPVWHINKHLQPVDEYEQKDCDIKCE